MTKAEIIAKIADDTKIDKLLVQESVEGFFTVVKDTMANGENLYVRGFGSFINKKRAEKVARNISKKTSITIPTHYIPSFKPAKTFVEQVKDNVKAD